MCDEYRVRPIPAYDIHSRLIHPTQYARKLKNAVVVMRFSLNHAFDMITADIVNLHVLVPPSHPFTAGRRPIALTDPFDWMYNPILQDRDRG